MFAIKTLSNLLSNDGRLPQGPETQSFEKPGDGDGIETIKESEDENKSEETIECRVEEGALPSEAAKVDVEKEKEKDDDSTAAISESSSSSSSHLRTEILGENAVNSPPPVTDKNNYIINSSSCSENSGIVSVEELKKDVNDEERKSIDKEGEDNTLLVQQKDDISLFTVKKIISAPSETEGISAVSFSAQEDVKSSGLTKQNNIDAVVFENQSNERKATMELDTKTAPKASLGLDHNDAQILHAEAAPERDSSPSCKSQAKSPNTEVESTRSRTVVKENAQSKAIDEGMTSTIVVSDANVAETFPKQKGQAEEEERAGLVARKKFTTALGKEPRSLNKDLHEGVSKDVVTGTQVQHNENRIDKVETKKEGKENAYFAFSGMGAEASETPPLTLAQRMKEMFDSSSPDQPSNAFGKNVGVSSVSEKPSESMSLTKGLKQMFDSPSTLKPSRAFGVGKPDVGKSKQRTASAVKLHCKNDTIVQKNAPKAEATKPTSPTSVADQMVSMLWASSTAKRRNDEKTAQESIDVVTRATAIQEENESDEDIEEITLDDGAISHDDSFEEIIEEITVEDNDEGEDDISVASNDEFFKNTARIEVEVSQDFVHTVEKGECDCHSYDEITADDCECDEKTIDDEVLQEDKDDDIEAKEIQEEEVEVKTKVGARVEVTSGEEESGHSDRELHGLLNLSRNDQKEKLAFETKSRGNPKHSDVKSLVTTFSIPSQTISTPKKTQDNRHINSSMVEKLNPRITRNRSAGGKLAEKLRKFDSPKLVSAESPPIIPKQSWERGKPMSKLKSSTKEPKTNSKKQEGTNPKTSKVLSTPEPRSEQADRLDEKSRNTSGYNEDEAIVDEIVSLVKEPGAMQNKHVLAERIKCLLIGQSKEKYMPTLKGSDRIQTKVLPPKQSLYSDSSKLVKSPLSKTNYVIEANSYLNRKNDKFMDPRLQQMRKEIKVQKEKLNHVDDPDTAENRRVIRISVTEPEQECGHKPTMKPAFEKAQKAVDPEAIMARIWPKTPVGEKCKSASSSFSSIFSKNTTLETQKISPRKLGNRLKMFENPPSSSLSPLRKNAGCFEMESIAESSKPCMRNISSSQVEAADGINQISKETVRRLSMFQRLWRTKKSERNTNTKENRVVVSKKKTVCAVSLNSKSYSNPGLSEKSIPTLIHAGGISVQASGSAAGATTAFSSSPNNSSSNRGCYYSLEQLEHGNFDCSVVDMERWEEFLSDASFYKHFSLTKEDFNEQPKWKRDKQKRRVRVAF